MDRFIWSGPSVGKRTVKIIGGGIGFMGRVKMEVRQRRLLDALQEVDRSIYHIGQKKEFGRIRKTQWIIMSI